MSLDSDPRKAPPAPGGAAGCRLVLLRHAKAVSKDEPIHDFDRPLKKRGRADAPRAGRRLADSGPAPDLVLCSPARRARQTWQLAAPALTDPPPAVYDERLYRAPPGDLVAVLAERGHGLGSVLLVGHNPGLHDLAVGLCGSGPPELLERLRNGFPTSGLVVIEVPGGWRRLSSGSGVLTAFWSPAG
ncbi:SixA phosphatase family protein [Streptomyces sp. NPDC058052]|uniref:SixA phosphatase family protein n=1 Tax=Streptomyces sp. NPDC058052 TaxID=3346316 RepID=UPI0036E1BA1D